ncbi:deoxyribonuclease IV (BER) (Nfo) [Proteiniborus sp. DW1]|uniref:sugar phosphate isomerase/epimerase family protein n=1 Tax=Proteiniborus sp. DW1 TaxID=1889883 RepID=UPI00092E087B|nr:sugar phosphate isomerase/epimerase [Proteiniborus sp. DW1]SCG82417.1 deoxyribonuclease IV (BER) (Nfo) [Proteiniborus sp. DW1]
MKLGMPALIEFNSLEENIMLCKGLGLDFIELNFNYPVFMPECLSHMEILDAKSEYGVDFTFHFPEEIDLSSFHPAIRKGHLDRCKELIEWMNKAEIKIANMHINNGNYTTLPNKRHWVNEKYEDQFKEQLFNSFSELNDYANLHGVILCIENTSNFHIPFIQRALDMLTEFENLYLTWDVGHDAMVNFKEEPILMKHASRIKHMHLHDFNGILDHQPLYTGIVPIDERLKFAKENNITVLIEVKTCEALKESLSKMADYR